MRIAILGAGFAGLAVTWHILRYSRGRYTIDLYDPQEIGTGSSGNSLGLLHPYPGKRAMRAWRATRSITEAHRLFTEASQAIGKPVVTGRGVLRPAVTEKNVEEFQYRVKQWQDIEWWDHNKCAREIPGLVTHPTGGGMFIPEGLTIDVKIYLEGLFKACVNLGTIYKQTTDISGSVLQSYDRVLVALGANSLAFGPLKQLPMTPIKGQILSLKWPKNVPPPKYALAGEKQLVMDPGYESCSVGATYERDFTSLAINEELAYKEIMPKILEFFPLLKGAEIVGVRTGVRACPAGMYPFVGKLSKNLWFMTGLGSKGLLYHAWLGKAMARAILKDDTSFLPTEALCQVQVTDDTKSKK
ncbi:MAG: NAD(P)/FAD-dependent oxidoreductase [Chlamydiales bacterium]